MHLRKLVINNFMPFKGKNNITLDSGLINIVGEWKGEPNRSNMAGKSAFIEAIIYLLYGKGRVTNEVDLINNQSEAMQVKGIFELDNGDTVTIIRGRDIDGNMLLELEGVEYKKSEMQQLIDEMVGLDYNEFKLTCYFGQGDINLFMNLSQAGRKEVLQKWISQVDWEIMSKKAAEKIKQLKVDIQVSESCITLIESQLSEFELLDLDDLYEILESEKKELKENLDYKKVLEKELFEKSKNDNYDSELLHAKKDIAKIKEEIDFLYELKEKSNIIKDEHDMLQKHIEEERQFIKDLRADIKDFGSTVDEVANKRQRLTSVLYSKKKDLEAFMEALESNTFLCPILKEHCDRISDLEYINKQKINKLKEIDKLKDEVKYIAGELDYIRGLRNDLNKTEVSLEKTKSILQEKKKQLELIKAHDDIDKTIYDLRAEYTDLRKKTEKLVETRDRARRRVIRLKDEISDLQDTIDNNHKSITEYNLLITEHKRKLKEIEIQKNKIKQYQDDIKNTLDKMNMYRFIAGMFSKQGIPSLEVNKHMERLQNYINDILEKLNTNMKIIIVTEEKLKALEPECTCGYIYKGSKKQCPECDRIRKNKVKNNFNIIIYQNNKPIPFELSSGGGKSLISLAIRLALVNMLKLRKKINLNILILDEIFGMLDVTNRLLVNDLVHYLCNEFEQVFVITHAGVHFTADQIIKVKKIKDHSRIINDGI